MLNWVHSCFGCTTMILSNLTFMQRMSAALRAQTKARKESSDWRPISHLRTAGQSQHEGGIVFFFFPSEIDTKTPWHHTYIGAAKERTSKTIWSLASHLPRICAAAGRSVVLPHSNSRGWGGRGMGPSLCALNIPLIPYAVTLMLRQNTHGRILKRFPTSS